jgi:hypothetical protein
MANVRSRKSRRNSRFAESEMRKVVTEIGARFSDSSLRRLIAAIHNNRPIVPPDDEGCDIGAMLLTTMVFATRITALKKDKSAGGKSRKRKSSERRVRPMK